MARAWQGAREIELMRQFFPMILKCIVCTSLGDTLKSKSRFEELANYYHECKLEMDKRILDIPGPESAREKEFQANLSQLKKSLKEMIDHRHENPKGKSKPLLDALINAGDSKDRMISDMITFLGGFHTASYYATWLFYYLAQHEDIQQKIIAEVRREVRRGHGESMKAYVLSSKTYLRQVLDEALRLSTTVPFSAHISETPVIVEDYNIPANTPIIHALCVLLKNEQVWGDPGKFDPDRFGPGTEHTNRGFEFRPFGVPNIRHCPANQFVYLVMAVILTIVLPLLKLRTVGSSFHSKYGIATSPKNTLYIEVEKRS